MSRIVRTKSGREATLLCTAIDEHEEVVLLDINGKQEMRTAQSIASFDDNEKKSKILRRPYKIK
eukprot:UN25851